MASIHHRIAKRIERKGPGWLFTARDFLDIADRRSVNKVLCRLAGEGKIQRKYRGIYYYPKMSVLGLVSPSLEELASAILPHEKIFFTGLQAANRMGFSTQVPAKIIFLTKKTSRVVHILPDGPAIRFKAAELPLLDDLSDIANLMLQGAYAMGEKEMDERNIRRSARVLGERDIADIKKAFAHLPQWLREVVLRVEAVRKSMADKE